MINLKDHIIEICGKSLIAHHEQLDEFTIIVQSKSITDVIRSLRDSNDIELHQLIDITAVDYPRRDERFNIVYHLLSLTKNFRLRIKTAVDEHGDIDSIFDIFPVANWFEREIWDMYGVFFNNHPDLRRILTDYGFSGHPQRKDFPLTGYQEMRYDPALQCVAYEPVALAQDFRQFDFSSPWQGMVGELPDTKNSGDEKAQ